MSMNACEDLNIQHLTIIETTRERKHLGGIEVSHFSGRHKVVPVCPDVPLKDSSLSSRASHYFSSLVGYCQGTIKRTNMTSKYTITADPEMVARVTTSFTLSSTLES